LPFLSRSHKVDESLYRYIVTVTSARDTRFGSVNHLGSLDAGASSNIDSGKYRHPQKHTITKNKKMSVVFNSALRLGSASAAAWPRFTACSLLSETCRRRAFRSPGSSAPASGIALVISKASFHLQRLRHESSVEITPRASSAGESARTTSRRWCAHRFSETLDRFSDDRRDLRRSDDLGRESSKLTLAIEPRSKLRVLALKTLDAFEQTAGSVTSGAPIAGIE